MALLHLVRDRSPHGLTGASHMLGRIVAIGGLMVAVACLTACESVPPELQPAQVLRDSLGLTERDVVFEIGVRTESGSEVATPARVAVRGPARLSFRSDDSSAHRITSDTTGLSPDQRDFARSFGQGSPPLVQHEARWVIDLTGAPPGHYTFRVTGSTREARVDVEVVQD